MAQLGPFYSNEFWSYLMRIELFGGVCSVLEANIAMSIEWFMICLVVKLIKAV